MRRTVKYTMKDYKWSQDILNKLKAKLIKKNLTTERWIRYTNKMKTQTKIYGTNDKFRILLDVKDRHLYALTSFVIG